MIKEKAIGLLFGGCILCGLIAVIYIASGSGKSDNMFEEFIDDKIPLAMWEPESESELKDAIEQNKDYVKENGLDCEYLSGQEFFYNGSYWSVVVTNKNGFPYEVIIYKDFSMDIHPYVPDSVEEGS